MQNNKRILIVDDQQDLREQLAKLLLRTGKKNETSSLVQQMRSRLLGIKSEEEDASETDDENTYQVDTAGQGEEAFEMVKKALDAETPYALMFLDMRMPPGWDGMETARRIREIDKNIEIVIMTAYADHDQATIADTVGTPEKLLYIKKPFQSEEIYQLALSLTAKWNFEEKERQRKYWLETLIRSMSKVKGIKTGDSANIYSTTLKAILTFTAAKKGFIADWNTTDSKWDIQHLVELDEKEVEDFVKENSERLYESRTTQSFAGKYLLPLKREGLSAIVILYDVEPKNDPEWYKLLSLLVMTSSEVLSSAIMSDSLLKKQQLSSLGTAVSKISHESRNHLNHLISRAGLLRDKLGDGDEKKLANEILSSAQTMLEQMNNVMTFSDNSPIETTETTDIRMIFSMVVDQAKQSETQLEIKADVKGEEKAPFKTRGNLLRGVFTNLVNNSIEAIKASNSKECTVGLNIAKEDNKYKLCYTDNGPGVCEEVKDTLFEPFITAGKDRGFGLGLAIARQIIEKHQGTISLDQDCKDGISFTIILPIPQD